MTRTAIYDAKENVLREQPQIEKPYRHFDEYDAGSEHWSYWLNEWTEFDEHVATLRTIPCSPECKAVFKGGEKYVEGKDYEVREITIPADHWQDVPTKRLRAFPIPVKSEDDLWAEVVGYLINNPGLSHNTKISDLKNSFTITKK